MDTDIYKSKFISNAFLFVRRGSNVNDLPRSVSRKLGKLDFFKSIVLDQNSQLIAVDPNEVITNIEENGYHIQGAKVSTEIPEIGAALGAGILTASLGTGPGVAVAVAAAVGYFLTHKAREDEDAS